MTKMVNFCILVKIFYQINNMKSQNFTNIFSFIDEEVAIYMFQIILQFLLLFVYYT